MVATRIDSPSQSSRYLMWLAYGNPLAPTSLFLTDWETDFNIGPLLVNAVPEMEITVPVNDGGLEEKPLELVVPVDSQQLFTDLGTGEAHSRVSIFMVEQIFDATGAVAGVETVGTYRGTLAAVVKNYQNRKGRLLLQFESIKSRFQAAMGLPANPQCPWTLGDQNCQATVTSEAGTITAIDKNRATITGLVTLPPADRYWQRGYVQVDGLRLGIRIWDPASPTIFELTSKVPARWLAQICIVTPGCDKTIETCRGRWSNEINFGGFGYGIPPYQPVYETPSL